MTNKKKFSFPNNLLKQLNECSFGGYILFNFTDKGEPQVFTKFDNQVNAMGLLYYLRAWIETIDQMNMDATADAIIKTTNSLDVKEEDKEDSEDEEDNP